MGMKKRNGEDFPREIASLKCGLNTGAHLANKLLYEVGSEWSINPEVFVDHRQSEEHARYHGEYMRTVARVAEFLAFQAQKFCDNEKGFAKALRNTYLLIPVIEMTVGDAVKWLERYKGTPLSPNKCRQMSECFPGLSIISLTRVVNGDKSGFEVYKAGKFVGHVTEESKLTKAEIPVNPTKYVKLLGELGVFIH